jgi:hypothetical protein
MLRTFIFLVLFAPSFALGKKVVVSGFAQTNSHRGIRFPIFVDEDEKPIPVSLSERAATSWNRLTEKGRTFVTIFADQKGEILDVYDVEKFLTEEKRKDSITALRFQALEAWEFVEINLRKNTPHAHRLLLVSNLVGSSIDHSNDKQFLSSIEALAEMAKAGIPENKIEHYFKAIDELLKLAHPDVEKLRARLALYAHREAKCVRLLTESQRQRAYPQVIENLKNQLASN